MIDKVRNLCLKFCTKAKVLEAMIEKENK